MLSLNYSDKCCSIKSAPQNSGMPKVDAMRELQILVSVNTPKNQANLPLQNASTHFLGASNFRKDLLGNSLATSISSPKVRECQKNCASIEPQGNSLLENIPSMSPPFNFIPSGPFQDNVVNMGYQGNSLSTNASSIPILSNGGMILPLARII